MNTLPTLLRLNSGSSTKEQIISILSREFPLSAKQIFNYLSRDYSNISYQAVHKALQELVVDGIVEKRDRNFLLSSHWIDNLNGYSEQLKYRYSNNLSETLDNRNFSFKTIHECDRFLIEAFVKIANSLPKGEKPLVIMQCKHAWVPLFISRTEYRNIVDALKSTNCYALVKGETKVDRWCCKFWERQGINVKFVEDVASMADIHVLGDYVIEVFYSPKVMRRMDEIYNKTKSVSELNMDDLFRSIFEMGTEIAVTINRNKLVADQLKEQTLSYFK